jgi:tripartite ATP-independent transporter DctP family solute receptor
MKTFLQTSAACLALLAAALPAISSAEVREQKLRMAITTSRDSYLGVGSLAFANAVKQKSGGKMTVDVFPDGVLGGEIAVLSSMRGGTVDAAAMSAGLLSGTVKEFGLFDLPYLFHSEQEAAEVLKGPFMKRLSAALTEKDLVPIAYWGVDYRNLTTTRKPVSRLEDVHGLKLRVLQSPVFLDYWKTLGANPVPLAFPELYGALEQGAVDGQENPFAAIESARLYEVQKNLTLTRHVYFVATAVLGKKTWDRLNDDERKVVRDAAAEAQLRWREAAVKEREALAVKLRKSMNFIELSPQELARFQAAAKVVTERTLKAADPDAARELMASIEKVRAAKPAGK